ncbi:ABC transporter substrate-binding protein [Phytohabitans kaempferiae]|uniref:ABC transporter substrate-binding protein n=1 Tax=Phytohabitans kaempferiae TaxID=1620943 RepID=A0ABV6M4A3_9ACTN
MAAVAMLLSGCGGGDSGDEGNEIVLDFPSWQVNEPGNGDVLKAIVADFEKTHPNVKVNLYFVSNDDFQNQMVTRLSAGRPPDVIASGNHFFAFAATGQLEPLDERLKSSGLLDQWRDFSKERIIDGQQLALPLHALTRVIFYNETFLQQAGVTAPPSTPEGLRDAVNKLGAAGGSNFNPWGATTTSHSNLFGESNSFIVGMGGAWITDGRWSVTDPKTVAAVELYRELAKKAPPGLNGGQYRQLLADGKVAMSHDGNWVQSFLDDNAPADVLPKIQAAPSPFQNSIALVGTSLSIPKGISDERKQLVWELIETAAKPEIQALWAEKVYAAPGRVGVVPAELATRLPVVGVVEKNVENAVPEFPPSDNFRANFGEIEKTIIDAMMRLLTTDDPTMTVLTDLEKKLAAITQP